jgi:ankyrin repeat protein
VGRAQNGYTALLAACANGHLDVARWLVTAAGSDVRSERDEVSSLCYSVCELGLVVMVRCFLLFHVVL